MFLEISQDSQEKQLCQSLFLSKVAGLLREPFLQITHGRLLLACLGNGFKWIIINSGCAKLWLCEAKHARAPFFRAHSIHRGISNNKLSLFYRNFRWHCQDFWQMKEVNNILKCYCHQNFETSRYNSIEGNEIWK